MLTPQVDMARATDGRLTEGVEYKLREKVMALNFNR